ncbi:wax ester/triacylglycerol synthase domain-containing protein [Streptomyces sp. M10(2022)]
MRERPLWSIHLVHGYAVGEYAVCYRVHHGLEDGLGAAHVATVLFGDTPHQGRTPRAGSRMSGTPARRSPPAPRAAARHAQRGRGHGAGLVPGRIWPKAQRPSPENLAMCSTSATRHELSELAREFGGTVNDVFLMALWGALSAWSTTGDGRRDVRSVFRASPVPVRMPLSTRHAGEEDAVGNHLTTTVVTLPAQELPPAEAFAQLVASTQKMRANGLRPASRALVTLLPAG